MKGDGWTWTLVASFLEIYNEQLRDLRHDAKAGAQPSYAIRDDEAWGTVVANMSRTEVSSMEQINRLMAKAAKARAVGKTEMNAQSSRSHSVFALYLHGTNQKLGALRPRKRPRMFATDGQ
jgi:kinesin family protein C1